LSLDEINTFFASIMFQKTFQHYAPSTKGQLRARNGTAAVETAILLPLLLLITFGSLELSNMVFQKQSLSIASYEGAKIATSPGTTDSQARTRVQEILTARGISNASISFTPAVNALTPRGTMVTVSVTSDDSAAGVISVRMFTPRTLRSETAMVRQ